MDGGPQFWPLHHLKGSLRGLSQPPDSLVEGDLLEFRADREGCVQREFSALEKAVLRGHHHELDALVENGGLDAGNGQDLKSGCVEEFNLFLLLVEDKIRVRLPVLALERRKPLFCVLVPRFTKETLRVHLYDLLNVLEVLPLQQAFLSGYAAVQLLDVLVSSRPLPGQRVSPRSVRLHGLFALDVGQLRAQIERGVALLILSAHLTRGLRTLPLVVER